MTFEEDFPSLKGKMLDVQSVDDCNSGMDTEDIFCDDGLLCYRSDIKQNCLDKQRVKDAILKHTNNCDCMLHANEGTCIEIIFKELGLELND